MQKNSIFIILFILVLVTGFLVSQRFPQKNMLSQNNFTRISTPAAALKSPNIYRSNTFGFTFEYPFNLQMKESSLSAITVGTINDLETYSEAEIKIIETSSRVIGSTESAAIREAKKLCKNISHDREISCPNVVNEKDEIRTDERLLQTFYLEEVTKSILSGETISIEQKGPFIVYPLNKTKTTETFIIFYPPLDRDIHMTNGQLVRDIAGSVKRIPVDTENPI